MHASPSAAPRANYPVALLASYATLWLGLALFAGRSTGAAARYDDIVATAVLAAALVLHFVATAAPSRASAGPFFLALAALTLPTGLLLLHDTPSPYPYLGYLALHGAIAAYIVHRQSGPPSPVPTWLAALQVAYVVLLLLDTLGRWFPALLYPAADLALLDALHHLSDVRMLLLSPIVGTWLVLAMVRCKRDRSFDGLPPVWQTDVSLLSALVRLPARFAAAVVGFVVTVFTRVWTDFLLSFRQQLRDLLRYLATIAAVGALLLAVRAYAPLLVEYLRIPTSFAALRRGEELGTIFGAPLVGFAFFLGVPLLTAAVDALWRSTEAAASLLNRAYQIAVVAAVPCTFIGLLLRPLGGLLNMPGFASLGIVSWISLIGVGTGFLVAARGPDLLRGRAILRRSALRRPASLLPSRGWVLGGAMLAIVFALAMPAAWTYFLQPTPLLDGMMLDRQRMREGKWRFYYVNVPAGVGRLEVMMADSAGGQLYTRYGKRPTLARQHCKASAQTTASCAHARPEQGRWWVGMRSSARSAARLQARFTYVITGSTGQPNVRILAVGKAATFQTVSDTSGRYVLSGLPAGTYRVRPAKADCTAAPDSHHVQVGPGSRGKNFRIDCPTPYTDLYDGRPLSGQRVPSGGWAYYRIEVPQHTSLFEVGIQGNASRELYWENETRPGANTSRFYYYPCDRGENATCRLSNPSTGIWWIGVRGGSPGGTYMITATARTSSRTPSLTAEHQAVPSRPSTLSHRQPSRSSPRR